MKVRGFFEKAIPAAAAVAVIAGCGSPHEAPAQKAPDGTVEQVRGNLDYNGTLGNAALTQIIRFKLDAGKHLAKQNVALYNYTESSVTQKYIQTMAKYYIWFARQDHGDDMVRVYDDKDDKLGSLHPLDTQVRTADEHDFLLVRPKTELPAVMTHGLSDDSVNTHAATWHDTGHKQEISVIRQPQDSAHNPQTFRYSESDLPTEICQSLVEIKSVNDAAADRKSQETVCIGLGRAVYFAVNNTSYDAYSALMKNDYATVPAEQDGTYYLRPLVLDESDYDTLYSQMAGVS